MLAASCPLVQQVYIYVPTQMIKMPIGSDGERIVAERCVERHDYVFPAVAVPHLHSYSCTEGHLHRHRSCRHSGQPVCHHCFRLVRQNYWQGIYTLNVYWIFISGTDLISYSSCSSSFVGATSSKPKFPSFQIGLGWRTCFSVAL